MPKRLIMNEFSSDNHSKARAILALGLSRESLAYTPPSDEELASLLEAGAVTDGAGSNNVGGLDSTRKAQIMDAIANDADTFSRWMSLVDAAETLELAGFSNEKVATKNTQSSVSAIKAFFTNPFKGLATAGGGLVAASALMLLVTTSDDFSSQVDQLYGDYGQEWSSRPADKNALRSVTSTFKKSLSAEDSALHAGVKQGLDRLGDDFILPNLAADKSLSSDEAAEKADLLTAGQIAAISHFKCSLEGNPEFFNQTLSMLEKLQPNLLEAGDETSKSLSASFARSGDAETKVCRFSKAVISRVTY